jgi:hypothetical protein
MVSIKQFITRSIKKPYVSGFFCAFGPDSFNQLSSIRNKCKKSLHLFTPLRALHSFLKKEYKKRSNRHCKPLRALHSFSKKEYKKRSLRHCKPLRALHSFSKKSTKKEAYVIVSLFAPCTLSQKRVQKKKLTSL